MTYAFPRHLRYSGISIAYQLCATIAGGTTPIIGTMIAQRFQGQWVPLALFFTVLSAVSLIGIRGLARHQNGRDSNENESIQAESVGVFERQGVN
jgi:hypothetical protein